MKLPVDSSAHGRLSRELADVGHDVLSVPDAWPVDPGDLAILARGFSESRVVIIRDKDFGELAVLRGQPHSGIVRLWDTPARLQFAVYQSVLERYKSDLLAGAIATASPYRIRLRPPIPSGE
jgi:predicted nuclease of predicted toxin-antitoxin system